MMNKYFFCLFLLLMVNISAVAQSDKVSGHIYFHDETLPYASVKNVRTQDVVLSDSTGRYEIAAIGSDSLICSYLGCSDKKVSVAGRSIVDVRLEEEATNLNEIKVVARRRPVQMSHNGFEINMNAVRKDGKLLSDVLSQLPMVDVKDNALTMVGKSKVLVYINHHQVYLSGDDLMAYLNSLEMDNIRKIHVISMPPAKYEAEGNVGIIQIETYNKINPGWQARLLGKATAAHYLSGGASARVLYSGKNFSIENTVLGNYDDDYTHSRYTNLFGDYRVSTDCPKESTEKTVMTLTTLSLVMNGSNSLSATLQLPWLSHGSSRDIANDTRYFNVDSAVPDSVMSSKGWGRSADYQASGEVNYVHSFNDNSNFNVTLGYINSYARDYRDWDSKTSTPTTTLDEEFYSKGHQKYDIYTLKADFSQNLKSWSLNEGYKFAYTHSTSYNEENEQLTDGAVPQNLFGYREQNHALYMNVESSIKSFSFDVGLRAELTMTKGISYSLDNTTRNHYVKLFPVMDLLYSAGDNDRISVSYSGRIKRPDYRLLDPFRWYTSKYDYSEGDPFLKPAYIYDLALSYIHGNSVYAKLYYTKTDNDFGQMVFLDHENIESQVERAGNFLDISEVGLYAEYSPQISSWLETELSGALSYSRYDSNNMAFSNVKGLGCVFSLDSTFYINKNLSSSLSMEDAVPGYYNYRKCDNAFLLNVGFSYTNNKKNVMASLRAMDLLRQGSPEYWYLSNGIKQVFNNYYDGRRVELSLTIKLGNRYNKTKTHFESSNSEERDRI